MKYMLTALFMLVPLSSVSGVEHDKNHTIQIGFAEKAFAQNQARDVMLLANDDSSEDRAVLCKQAIKNAKESIADQLEVARKNMNSAQFRNSQRLVNTQNQIINNMLYAEKKLSLYACFHARETEKQFYDCMYEYQYPIGYCLKRYPI